MKRTLLIIIFLNLFLVSIFGRVVCADNTVDRVKDLVSQVNGKVCKFQLQGSSLIYRSFLSSFIRRNDKEQCIMDAARALGMMGADAKAAVPALIDALRNFRNVDSGDGIIPVRSEIALALGRIGDPSAIKALVAVLSSDDSVTLSQTASVYAGYKLSKRTSYGAVAKALAMFGPQAKEALPVLNNLWIKGQEDLNAYERREIEMAIKKINE